MLRDRQVGVVFVSHILEDVMALCDEVTVLRDGQRRDGRAAARGADRVRRSSTRCSATARPRDGGRDDELRERGRRAVESRRGGGRLELREGVRSTGALEPLGLASRRGEIVGLAGRRGRGPPHRARARQRAAAGPDAGRVLLPGRAAGAAAGCARRSRAGVALVTGDRRRLGLMLDKPMWENIGQIRSVGLAADGP